jgi:anaerobic magnesium-protoporphyrin IX monomethyl ester cyclase
MLRQTTDQDKSLDAILIYIEAAALPCVFSRRPQLGLYYIAQNAVNAGYRVAVDNLSSNDHLIRRIHRILNENSCQLLGFYVDQDNLWTLRRIAPKLTSMFPDLNIVLGGPQMTADPEVTLERIPEALCGVIGEGEETFVDLLGLSHRNSQSLKACSGLAFRTDNGIYFTEHRNPVESLDRLPMPQRQQLTLNSGRISPIMITGRGCSGRCAFCFEGGHKGSGKRLRLHSVERTLAEFDYLVQTSGDAYISIVDDTFVTSIKRLHQFCRALISLYQGRVKWFCESRVDILAHHPELMPLMIEAGLIRIQVGGESGSQQILNVYRKGTTLEEMYQVVENAKTNGLLSLFANFIIGGAFETRRTFDQTLAFALELLNLAPGCMSLGSSFYTPYPGTPMYENPQDFGIEVMDPEVVTGTGDHHPFCRTAALSRYDILALKAEFDSKVKAAMGELSLQLPPEQVKRHFQAFYDWKLSTEWHDILAENELWHLYYKSVLSSGAKTFSEIDLQQFQEALPMRIVDPVATKECNYLVRTPSGVIREVDALGSMVLDLSAGKLCFGDIMEILISRFPDLPHDSLRREVIDRYHSFDHDCLLVWRITD